MIAGKQDKKFNIILVTEDGERTKLTTLDYMREAYVYIHDDVTDLMARASAEATKLGPKLVDVQSSTSPTSDTDDVLVDLGVVYQSPLLMAYVSGHMLGFGPALHYYPHDEGNPYVILNCSTRSDDELYRVDNHTSVWEPCTNRDQANAILFNQRLSILTIGDVEWQVCETINGHQRPIGRGSYGYAITRAMISAFAYRHALFVYPIPGHLLDAALTQPLSSYI